MTFPDKTMVRSFHPLHTQCFTRFINVYSSIECFAYFAGDPDRPSEACWHGCCARHGLARKTQPRSTDPK